MTIALRGRRRRRRLRKYTSSSISTTNSTITSTVHGRTVAADGYIHGARAVQRNQVEAMRRRRAKRVRDGSIRNADQENGTDLQQQKQQQPM